MAGSSSKLRVALMFGGRSAEHDVSLLSAANVLQALDTSRYDVVLIAIDRQGRWFLSGESRQLLDAGVQRLPLLADAHREVALVPGTSGAQLLSISERRALGCVDVVFPVLHGPYGEDGSVQGLLRLANIPYVGAGVLGSAIALDKDVTKRLLRDAGIPVARWLTVVADRPNAMPAEMVEDRLGLPVFVKPASLGSSVGVSKVTTADALADALDLAFEYDRKVLIEEYVPGRELECAVLGYREPIASAVGEVTPQHEFYSYEAKYLDEHGAVLVVPAKISEEQRETIRSCSLRAFTALCCEGMARVDFFLTGDGRIVLNEVNTIPGFTKASMYPRLWESSGLVYSALLDRLIASALERFDDDQRLRTDAPRGLSGVSVSEGAAGG